MWAHVWRLQMCRKVETSSASKTSSCCLSLLSLLLPAPRTGASFHSLTSLPWRLATTPRCITTWPSTRRPATSSSMDRPTKTMALPTVSWTRLNTALLCPISSSLRHQYSTLPSPLHAVEAARDRRSSPCSTLWPTPLDGLQPQT